MGENVPAADGWAALLGGTVLRRTGSPVIRFRGARWDSLLASRSHNTRAQVRRRERKLNREHDVRFRLADDRDRLDDDLGTLFALHRARWGGRGTQFSESGEAFHRDFAHCAFNRGWLRLWLLEVDGAAVSAWYGFRYGGARSRITRRGETPHGTDIRLVSCYSPTRFGPLSKMAPGNMVSSRARRLTSTGSRMKISASRRWGSLGVRSERSRAGHDLRSHRRSRPWGVISSAPDPVYATAQVPDSSASRTTSTFCVFQTVRGTRIPVCEEHLAEYLPQPGEGFYFGSEDAAVRLLADCRAGGSRLEGGGPEPRITLHSCRHSYSTFLDAAGVSETRADHLHGPCPPRRAEPLPAPRQYAEDAARLDAYLSGATSGKVVPLPTGAQIGAQAVQALSLSQS